MGLVGLLLLGVLGLLLFGVGCGFGGCVVFGWAWCGGWWF